MTERVKEILSYYPGENPKVLKNLARILNHGTLAGTGKVVLLPVDQGWEHGPVRSFGPNPPAYDPDHHFNLAIQAGCNGYAAPLGFIEAGALKHAKHIPLILKLSSNNSLYKDRNPVSVQTGSVQDAIRLGCVAIGYTIYPGSANSGRMYEQVRGLAEEAKKNGLVVIIWSYPRGEQISKEGETAIDIIAYSAHIAAQLGAHIIKVKFPSSHIEQDEARKIYATYNIPIETPADRVRHIVQAAFNGKRILIFSGGAKDSDEALFEKVHAIRDGGGYGSIIGRNSFQRPFPDAVKMLRSVMEIYKK